MNKKEAINYLQEKGKIRQPVTSNPDFNKSEEQEIEKVIKQGKIYGDPLVEVDL